MEKIFNTNGLVVWNEEEIALRNYYIVAISTFVKKSLWEENKAWAFRQVESTTLIPKEFVNPNYTEDDVFFVKSEDNLVLRPETTAGSYEYAKQLMQSNKALPPLCIWQAGKSFRNEQDQVTKHMRLKEFYQLEFQCLYADTTKNDYHAVTIPKLLNFIRALTKSPARCVDSDRLPSYSLRTKDIEVFIDDRWMEIMSVSLRNDFGTKITLGNKATSILVLEIAVGLDRLVHNHFRYGI